MEHTKTHWIIAGNLVMSGDGKETIAIVPQEANARFIVRAVNNHDKLVEALESLFDDYENWTGSYTGEAIERMRKQVQQVLKKAEAP